MKYYSDKTKKLYENVELLTDAEKIYDEVHAEELKKAEEKKQAAEAIKAARKEMIDAQNKYSELLNQFIKEYGSYHETFRDGDVISLRDIFNLYW